MPKLVLEDVDLEQIKILNARGFNYQEIALKIDANPTTVWYYVKGDGIERLREIPIIEDKKRKEPSPLDNKPKRHPAVYTNGRSPFGIADSLHETPLRRLK